MSTELNIQNKKMELIQWISTLEDSSIIEKIMELRKRENVDWWNSISEDEKRSIERGLEDAESGKLNPHSDARKLYENGYRILWTDFISFFSNRQNPAKRKLK